MTGWEEARQEILQRWTEVRRLIDARDEASILPLINRQDEFCERADISRKEAHAGEGEGTFCRFCPGFAQSGGCLGRLAALNHAVLISDWREAARITDDYLHWVEHLQIDESRPALPVPLPRH
jgi:hypothetical protein